LFLIIVLLIGWRAATVLMRHFGNSYTTTNAPYMSF